MRVTIFDYGAGNLHSIAKALTATGADVCTECDPARLTDTDALVLPGVGAFEPAAARLAPALADVRRAIAGGLPTLGVCLGMQLLFDESAEGPGSGLGIFRGHVERLRASRVPQIGWNALDEVRDDLFNHSQLVAAYYANSFVCRADDPGQVIAWSTHEHDRFPAAVRMGSAVGVQFHPEKSSAPGLRFLELFIQEASQ